jgi:Mrp family chromosome partitioning ATPase
MAALPHRILTVSSRRGYMEIAAVTTQKGGAGKTTLAVQNATATVAAGHSVAQATAASWGDRRTAGPPE